MKLPRGDVGSSASLRRLRTRLLAAAAALAAACGCGPAEVAAPPEDAVPALAARCDAAGVFVLDDPSLAGRVFAGPGVPCVVGAAGRVAPDAAEPRVWLRREDGTFDQRALRFTRASLPLDAALADALAALAGARGGESWHALLAVSRGVAGLPRPELTLDEGDDAAPAGPPPPGAPLEDWAPARWPFVRFRSVEAAYRFAGIADEIGARLLAAAGEGRDRGTLRLVLHDLALPEIWQANPETEKGVGECALVFVPQAGGGRVEAALLLRITDPETHRMQTDAGLSWHAMPEHRWTPADDPDPASRERRNVRAIAGDVEIVATSQRVLDRIARVRTVATVAADPEWRDLRGAAPPERSEAMHWFQTPRARRAWDPRDAAPAARALARREFLGWRHVLRSWTGIVPRGTTVAAAPAAVPDLSGVMGHLVAVRAVTDAKGANVEAVFDDDAAAAAAESALAACAAPLADASAVCRTNRRLLEPLAFADRAPGDLRERAFVVLGWRPVCPCGGGYGTHPVTREVHCTAHGADDAPLPAPPAPRALVRGVAREGRTVRFRVPIDW